MSSPSDLNNPGPSRRGMDPMDEEEVVGSSFTDEREEVEVSEHECLNESTDTGDEDDNATNNEKDGESDLVDNAKVSGEDGSASDWDTDPETSRDGASVLDTQSSSEESDDGRQRRTNQGSPLFEDSLMSDSEMEYEDEETTVGPDTSCADLFEIRQEYTKLMDSCREFDEASTPEAVKILEENICSGQSLFKQLGMFNEGNVNSDEGQGRRAFEHASGLLLPCAHNNICAKMILQKVKGLGLRDSPFKIENFLQALKNKATDLEGNYSALDNAKILAETNATVSKTAPKVIHKPIWLSNAEVQNVVQNAAVAKKPVHLRDKSKNNNPTQMEAMNKEVTAGSSNDLNKCGPEVGPKSLLKRLRKKHRENKGESQSMLDILYDKDDGDSPSVSDFAGRAFDASVLVQQGLMGLSIRDDVEGREASALLMMCQPEKPLQRASANTNAEVQRQQIIGSFSTGTLKELMKSQPDK